MSTGAISATRHSFEIIFEPPGTVDGRMPRERRRRRAGEVGGAIDIRWEHNKRNCLSGAQSYRGIGHRRSAQTARKWTYSLEICGRLSVAPSRGANRRLATSRPIFCCISSDHHIDRNERLNKLQTNGRVRRRSRKFGGTAPEIYTASKPGVCSLVACEEASAP